VAAPCLATLARPLIVMSSSAYTTRILKYALTKSRTAVNVTIAIALRLPPAQGRGSVTGQGSISWPEGGRMDSKDSLLTTVDAAARISVKPSTLARLRRQGRGPRYIKISRKVVRYRPSDLARWLEKHLVSKRTA